MADSCVPEFRRGAELPGWLNGSRPTMADGAVRRKVCFPLQKQLLRILNKHHSP